MASLNKVILIGNLGSDPEIRYTGTGSPVANFNIATNETWTGKDGERNERTEWHRIVVWGKLAETASEYLKKGKQVYVEGRLQTRQWQDREGGKRQTTEVVASTVLMLGPAPGDRMPADRGTREAPPVEVEAGDSQAPPDDDLPF
jgi:single-strand DNA-binding protein